MAKLNRRLAGGRNPTRNNPAARFDMSGVVTQNVTVPDINHGAWSLIDQPPATDSPGEIKDYAFL